MQAPPSAEAGPALLTTNLTNGPLPNPTITVIPETREAESSGIYFLQWFQVVPGQLAALASGMTITWCS